MKQIDSKKKALDIIGIIVVLVFSIITSVGSGISLSSILTFKDGKWVGPGLAAFFLVPIWVGLIIVAFLTEVVYFLFRKKLFKTEKIIANIFLWLDRLLFIANVVALAILQLRG